MLKRLSETIVTENKLNTMPMPIVDAAFPRPRKEQLEYSSPARGSWNIVHTGMLIPESHQVFVCAKGCLRGVVLTAAEMNAMGRYSAVEIREEQVLNGNMEEFMISGISDVLEKLPYEPKAVLVFISCQHFFLSYDQAWVYEELRARYPQIRFVDCYMIPTLRKSGLTPDQKMRVQMYRMLENRPKDERKVHLIGSDLVPAVGSELRNVCERAGKELVCVQDTRTFDEYLALSEAALSIGIEPLSKAAGEDLRERMGIPYLYLPNYADPKKIAEVYRSFYGTIGKECDLDDWFYEQTAAVYRRAKEVKERIGDTKVVLDYTFTFRILNLTRFLIDCGFRVDELYADVFLPEEKEDFEYIKKTCPELKILPTAHIGMRTYREEQADFLALGQKAAYFSGTDHFVNMAEGGGLFGFEGILTILDRMEEAYLHEMDRKEVIQRKGYGCESCIGFNSNDLL